MRVDQWLYDRRDPVSWALALGMALPLWWLAGHWVQAAPEVLQEMTALLEVQAPPTPLPPPPLPAPRSTPQPRQAVNPVPVPVAPVSAERVPLEHPAAAPHAAPTAPAPTAATHAPPAPAEEARPAARASAYEGLLLAYLERIKRYPSSREARLSKPQGTVRLWLVISRQGELLEAGVLTSSGSNLLDNEALRSVRAGQFPAFPEEAFAGESRHRFTVNLKYQIEG